MAKNTSQCRVLIAALLALFFTVGARATGIIEESVDETPQVARTIEVRDGLGRPVVIPSDPQRIVTAGRAVLMIADAIYLFPGADKRIVGVGRINQGKGNCLEAIDPNYDEKAKLERNVGPEQIVALEPDLVLLKSTMREQLGLALERIGLPVVYLNLETPEQYQEELVLLGDREAHAQARRHAQLPAPQRELVGVVVELLAHAREDEEVVVAVVHDVLHLLARGPGVEAEAGVEHQPADPAP